VISGACLCGTVRFETEAGGFMGYCHCSICRKWTGAAFGVSLNVRRGSFRFVEGHSGIASYAVCGGAGERRHCRTCGSSLPGGLATSPLIGIPAGLLDGDPGVRPAGHVFAQSRVPWLTIDDGLPAFDRHPPGVEDPDVDLGPSTEWKSSDWPIRGSCLCGTARYELDPIPARFVRCHCSRCRRATGSAYACNLIVAPQHHRWTSGESQVARYDLPQARSFANSFCRRCGSPMPHPTRSGREIIVPTGTLDGDPRLKVHDDIFLADRALWLLPDEARPRGALSPRRAQSCGGAPRTESSLGAAYGASPRRRTVRHHVTASAARGTLLALDETSSASE